MSNVGTLHYTVTIHREDSGGLWAAIEELPGCFAAGDDESELQEALTEAIGMYLSEPDSVVNVRMTNTEQVEQVEQQKYLVCH